MLRIITWTEVFLPINALLQKKPKHKKENAWLFEFTILICSMSSFNNMFTFVIFYTQFVTIWIESLKRLHQSVFCQYRPIRRRMICLKFIMLRIVTEKQTACHVHHFYSWILRYNYNNYVLDFLCLFFTRLLPCNCFARFKSFISIKIKCCCKCIISFLYLYFIYLLFSCITFTVHSCNWTINLIFIYNFLLFSLIYYPNLNCHLSII